MDDKYILGPHGELYHWGIKGMRWGVRRYQNKDGSLTKAGRKRYAEENEKLKAREKEIKGREKAAARQAKLDAKKAELDAREAALKGGKTKAAKKLDSDGDVSKSKSIKDMTDDELREHINRMTLEKNYLDAQRNLATLAPKKTSNGKDFVNGLLNDVIMPSAKTAGKEWLEKYMKNQLGLNKKESDPIKALEKTRDKLKLEKEIRDLKKGEPTLKELIERYGNLTPEERNVIEFAANNRFFEEGLRGKGVKPDKGKDKKKKDDDDD